MEIFEIINKLNTICNKNDICEITREDLDVITLEGMPIKYNDSFLLFAYNYDFEFDGYKIIMIKDITYIKYDEVDLFINNILKKENIRPSIKDILCLNIDSFIDIFKNFYKNKENIIIECEKYSEFYIGKITEIFEDHILFLNFDGEGTWDKESSEIYYNDITSISFRSRYIKYMSKYTHY